jgi:hypothetical protein
MKPSLKRTAAAALAILVATPTGVMASSHREAPFITLNPKVDGADFYMFRSYEAGRENFVTMVANYVPLQDAYGAPNYFTMDENALYEIHIDNNGDSKEDLTFQFKFDNDLAAGGQGLAVAAGDKMTPVAIVQIGGITAADTSKLNVTEKYSLTMVRGDRRSKNRHVLKNADTQADSFKKPADYIGTKTFGPSPGYGNYARTHIYNVAIPECATPAKVFVGQRKESFALNLGAIFDLVNAPAEIVAGGSTREARSLVPSTIENKNITSLALELPIECVQSKDAAVANKTIIGAWTTASVRQARIINPRPTFERPTVEGGAWTQVSRLSMPLVNELVIGIKDKNKFNASEPKDDGQFIDYVTNPSLPELLEILFGAAGVRAPNKFPRTDLIAAFLTGVPNVNANGATSEMQRLNLALPATAAASQNSLGAAACFVGGALTLGNAGCDPAGFPNGRRPGDDIVDITLRVAMGYLLPVADAASANIPFTDATLQESSQFDATFPYLKTPMPGAN